MFDKWNRIEYSMRPIGFEINKEEEKKHVSCVACKCGKVNEKELRKFFCVVLVARLSKAERKEKKIRSMKQLDRCKVLFN